MYGKVVGYFGSWSIYNKPEPFAIGQIDPQLFTHLIYAFANVDGEGVVQAHDLWADLPPNCNGYGKMNALKRRNPALKTLISVGGASCPSAVFSSVVANASKRKRFVDNMIDFARRHGFDGVDIDWEFPAKEGGSPADKANFAQLLQEMRPKFDQNNLLMTAAVSNFGESVAVSYDVPALNRYLDFINLMAYDYNGAGWSHVTGQNAPLYANPVVDKTPYSMQANVDAGVRYWLDHGAHPSKLVLGVAMYGQVFTLANASNRGLGAPVVKTSSTPTLAYTEICRQLRDGGWQVFWDDTQRVPFATNGRQWIGYDNPKSVTIKASYARQKGLGGVMVWSVEKDFSADSKYQLLTVIANEMGLTGQRR